MLQEIDECVAAGHDFAFETTLSGLSYLRKIKRWQTLGYEVKLWFLSLPSGGLAVDSWAMYDSYVYPPKLIDWSK